MEDDTQILDYESRSISDLQETRADRLRQSVTVPDFSPSEIQTTKDVLSESTMELSDAERSDILRSSGVYASTSKQVSTAIENALIGMNQLPDEATIAFGNIANYITGGALGEELQNIAYESMAHRYAEMANNEDAIGGIRSELAQLAGGATSFLQLALEGIATSGVLSLSHIGAQAFGEGVYNDMKAYADKHDGSLEGYRPKGIDLAINTANTLLQVVIEEKFGAGSPNFIKNAALRGGVKEFFSGAMQESAQGALADLAEAIKGNEDISILIDNVDQYVRDGIIGGVLQGAVGAATYHQSHAKATNNLSNVIAKARGHETPTTEDQQQAETIIDANERGYASMLVNEFKAVFDASTGEGKLQKNILTALNDAVAKQELDLGIADETERAQKLEAIATQETLNAMEMAQEQGKSVSEMELNNIVYRDGAIWLEGMAPQIGARAADQVRVLAERQSGLAETQAKLDTIQQEVEQTKKDLAEAKAANKEAFVQKLQARLDKQNALAEKRRLQTEKLKAQTEKIEAQIAKQFNKESAELASAAKATEQIAEKQEAPRPVEEPKPLAEVTKKTQKPKAEKKSLKAERVGKMKDTDIERYDPNKQYNKYDVVKIKTNSGEHLGVWGGDRMWLFETIDQAQQYIQNDKEITALREQEEAESARREKERVAKQEKALRDGDGWVDGEYIVQRLKDNDMWEGLSLREKGNLNAIGSVMFINGEIVNAFGNANSKKGTKVTANTLNTIDALRNKINQQNQEVGEEEGLLHQPTLDKQKKDTIIGEKGGPDAKQQKAARTAEIINSIRGRMRGRPDAAVWVDTSTGDSGVQQTPGVRSVNLSKEDQAALNEQGVSTPNFTVYDNAEAGAQEFLDAMQAAKAELGEQAASVDVKELSDYQGMKTLILSEDKKTGCAITKDGDIVSLFSASSERGRAIPMLLLAIQNGGTKLDCYDIYLPSIYSKVGFKAVARNNWVEMYKPDGWNKDYFKSYNNGEPDVVFMVYDPNNTALYNKGDGKLIKSGDTDADYGLGMKAQDEALAEIAYQQAQGYKHMMVPGNQMLRQEELDDLLHQEDVYDGLTTTNSVYSVVRKIQSLQDGKAERILYDTENNNWYLADADEFTHVDIFGKAYEQANYPQFNNKREAEQFFNENYTADEQTLLSFLAQKFYTADAAKMFMEKTLGLDEYRYAYLRDNMVIYARYESDLQDAGFPTESFDVYKINYDENGERKIVLVEEHKTSNKDMEGALKQSKAEGTGSDKYRGGYDEQLKRIILGEKSDITTIQHEFAHYWIQNNFKWARSGLASQDWLRRWRDVEEALGIEPQDRLLSRQASEKFARAYERYIMEGKVAPELQWAFDGFQKFYADTYEDLENEYFDLSQELDPAIVDWFNRQRPATEQSLKDQAYKNVATAAMAEGADIVTETGDGQYVVSSMNNKGEVTSDVVVSDEQTKDSQLAVFSDKKKNRRVVEGLRESNPDIKADQYNVLNRAETVEQAQNWISRDREGAWEALNNPNTNPIDRTALFQAFKNEAENGDYALGAELASIKFPKEMTELGQAISVLGERGEFDPLTILEEKQKSLGEPTAEEVATQTSEMGLDADLDADQVKDLEETTECVL